MSILKNIFDKIFHRNDSNTSTTQSTSTQQNNTTTTPSSPAAATQSTPTSGNTAIADVDVEKILNDLAKKSGQPLNWRTSIVDLLKLLEIDSSLQARKQLAHELNFSGDTNDSASMNIWLHKQVMNSLAANGGKVPPELKD